MYNNPHSSIEGDRTSLIMSYTADERESVVLVRQSVDQRADASADRRPRNIAVGAVQSDCTSERIGTVWTAHNLLDM